MSSGALAVDTDAPAGAFYVAGFRRNASGALYGTTVTDPSDVYMGGVRRTTAGQLVYADSDPTAFQNGNPITALGAMACALI